MRLDEKWIKVGERESKCVRDEKGRNERENESEACARARV